MAEKTKAELEQEAQEKREAAALEQHVKALKKEGRALDGEPLQKTTEPKKTEEKPV